MRPRRISCHVPSSDPFTSKCTVDASAFFLLLRDSYMTRRTFDPSLLMYFLYSQLTHDSKFRQSVFFKKKLTESRRQNINIHNTKCI
jgi:hypothetical protein